MIFFRLFPATLILSLLTGVTSAATVVWHKTPLKIELVVGVEQMVVLPRDGAVGLPAELSNPNIFRTLVTGGTAYWTALEPFENKRIKVRLDSGEFILFDVSARTEKAPPAAMETVQIVLSSDSEATGDRVGQGGGPARASVFELIRYAAQAQYSPARLVAPVPGIRPVPVGLSGNLTQLYDQGRHRGLIVLPHKAWAVDGLYVTSFIVTNEHSHPITLDNRKVHHAPGAQRSGVAPHFVASAFFDTALSPRDTSKNRTTLFVVTDQPIRTVIRGI